MTGPQRNPSRDLSGLPKNVERKLRDIWLRIFGPPRVPKWPPRPFKWPPVPEDLGDSEPPSPVFYVSGDRFGPFSSHRPWLFDNEHRIVTLRGVNLPVYDDWEFPVNAPVGALNDVALSGANCVRLQWYADYENPDRGRVTLDDLHRVLETCRQSRLIPILTLFDGTPGPIDRQQVQEKMDRMTSWWLDENVRRTLRRHERYLIVNFANECGVWEWGGADKTARLNQYENFYTTLISRFRQRGEGEQEGLRVPLMIDAPDGGTSVHSFLAASTVSPGSTVAQALQAADVYRNVLFSTHSYWGGTDRTQDLLKALEAELPVVVGEVANKQFDKAGASEEEQQCYYGLDGTKQLHEPASGFQYQDLLRKLADWEVGWLGWSWYKDKCPARRMTQGSRGTYDGAVPPAETKNTLTDYGTDILFNTRYGIRTGSAKATRTPSLPGSPPSQ